MKRILDPEFEYRPSFATDVRETFEKVRERQASAEQSKRLLTRPGNLLNMQPIKKVRTS